MRLKPEQTQFIKSTVARHFGEEAQVWLFGSRVDDAKRGGDVDLFVQPGEPVDRFLRRMDCLSDLEDGLPYPVDLVVEDAGRDLAIYRIARSEGVLL
jgi:predicted nucleotidyltransferase